MAFTLEVRGLTRAQGFLFNLSGRLQEAAVRALVNALVRIVLPELRAVIRVRSGRLRGSLAVVAHTDGASIVYRFYGRFPNTTVNGLSVQDYAISLIQRPDFGAYIAADIRRQLGI